MGLIFSHVCRCSSFNQDLSKWDVENVHYGYVYAQSFNQDLSAWDVSSGTDFRMMFTEQDTLIKISNWDVSNGLQFGSMFIE